MHQLRKIKIWNLGILCAITFAAAPILVSAVDGAVFKLRHGDADSLAFDMASYGLKFGDYLKAKVLFDRLIAAKPTDANLYAERGDCLSALGHTDEAIADWTRAIEFLGGGGKELHDNRGMALLSQGKALAAHSDFQLAVKLCDLEADKTRFLLHDAESLLYLNRLNESHEICSTIIDKTDDKIAQSKIEQIDHKLVKGQALFIVSEIQKRRGQIALSKSNAATAQKLGIEKDYMIRQW